jgi:hypothetical protein
METVSNLVFWVTFCTKINVISVVLHAKSAKAMRIFARVAKENFFSLRGIILVSVNAQPVPCLNQVDAFSVMTSAILVLTLSLNAPHASNTSRMAKICILVTVTVFKLVHLAHLLIIKLTSV